MRLQNRVKWSLAPGPSCVWRQLTSQEVHISSNGEAQWRGLSPASDVMHWGLIPSVLAQASGRNIPSKGTHINPSQSIPFRLGLL